MDDWARRDRYGAGRRRVVAWLPVVAWAGVIFAFSAQPNLRFVPDAGVDFLVRKAGHMGVFGILALLLWRAVGATTALRRPWAWALAVTILYAITDELHQGFVAGRHPSPVDVGIDAAGALVAVVVVGVVRVKRRWLGRWRPGGSAPRLAPPRAGPLGSDLTRGSCEVSSVIQ